MCWATFIATTVAGHDAVSSRAWPSLRLRVVDSIGGTDRILWTLDSLKGCGCGLYREPPDWNAEQRDLNRVLTLREADYRKRGWSESKIQRALASARSQLRHRAESCDSTPQGPVAQVREVVLSTVHADPNAELVVLFGPNETRLIRNYLEMPSQTILLDQDDSWASLVHPNTRYTFKGAARAGGI
jgi:hypothetical protein